MFLEFILNNFPMILEVLAAGKKSRFSKNRERVLALIYFLHFPFHSRIYLYHACTNPPPLLKNLIRFCLFPSRSCARVSNSVLGCAADRLEQPFTKSQLLLASNPVHKSVPVLIHNDKPICESLIILEYIDSTWAEDESRPFFPKDPHGQTTARFWADFINKMLEAGRNTLKTTGEEEEKCKQEFIEGAIILDEALGKMQGPFFGGSFPSTRSSYWDCFSVVVVAD